MLKKILTTLGCFTETTQKIYKYLPTKIGRMTVTNVYKAPNNKWKSNPIP